MNTCGECSECCLILEVHREPDELALAPTSDGCKPRDVLCRHCDDGCMVYTDPKKPSGCNAYRCAWLKNDWVPELRPDQCGGVISVKAGVVLCSVSKERSGAWREGALLQKLREYGEEIVLVVCGDEKVAFSWPAVKLVRNAKMELAEIETQVKEALGDQGGF